MGKDIGEVIRLVCVGDGIVAAIGTKKTLRFDWSVANSRGNVVELDDLRVNMAVYRGYPCTGNLAFALPRGATIPLPSVKRAKVWFTHDRGPRPGSRWFFESALEAGFKPRFYLGEERNPYEEGTHAQMFWNLERTYLPHWVGHVIGYQDLTEGIAANDKEFLARIPDWQTRVLVAWMGEDEFLNGNYEPFREYVKATPLV